MSKNVPFLRMSFRICWNTQMDREISGKFQQTNVRDKATLGKLTDLEQKMGSTLDELIHG